MIRAGYHQAHQHTHAGNSEGKAREKSAERIFEEINIPKLPKFDEKHESTHSRSAKNSHLDKLKDSHTDTQYCQTVDMQRQRES